jgi:hypothetical protein
MSNICIIVTTVPYLVGLSTWSSKTGRLPQLPDRRLELSRNSIIPLDSAGPARVPPHTMASWAKEFLAQNGIFIMQNMRHANNKIAIIY